MHFLQAPDDDAIIDLPDPDLEQGVLPTEIRKLVQSRRQVKEMMKASGLSAEQYMQVGLLPAQYTPP